MSGRGLFAVLAAAALVLTALTGLLARQAWDVGGEPRLAEPLAGGAFVEPQQHLFADAVRARVELLLDRDRVDPDTVKVSVTFTPYRQLRPPRRTRIDAGSATRLELDYLLACRTERCLPSGTGTVDFGRVTVEYRDREAPVTEIATIDWPSLRATGRIAPERLEQAALRAEIRELPPPSYRVSPRDVESVALALAVLFGAAALILVLRLLPLERLAARLGAKRADRRSALERALALVRESARVGSPQEGRRALERLAHELRRARNPQLAHDASRLAWSRREPAGAGVDPLSQEVERVISERT